MAKNFIFKTLIDILFIFQGFGIFGAFVLAPFGIAKINQVNLADNKWPTHFWILLLLGIIAYIMFMIGIYHLRKVGRYLLSKRYFTVEIISNLKRSGVFLIFSGVLGLMGFIINWILRLEANYNAIYGTEIALPFFIGIVGLFFVIQSEALLFAKNFKEENDLTI
ncbi:DUF2975 domain-containing protein [Flavobacteriaceae bacterium XHP0103]|uniref:DUF2975 domain-containing protein n=1 Tax=Marixanthotalea marina TaxID=2844359 RepID=UPI00298A00FA|nr:DUF2975 domain-containing protein [Marixanthotalea marina]MBU3820802.1 DUF2975 domain-containing protein [Marixanthotalea marina]